MQPLDCPFRTAEKEIEKIKKRTPVVIVDFHAEATSEKKTMGWFLDGRVSAVIGTHTHVQTADERILPGGTGYLTDAGMCGSATGVIGMDPALSVKRYVSQMPLKMQVHDGPAVICGAVVDVDPGTGRCVGLSRLRL